MGMMTVDNQRCVGAGLFRLNELKSPTEIQVDTHIFAKPTSA